MTRAPLLLTPRIRRYAWGDPTFIPELLGMEVTGQPCAEAWFGAHPTAPALAHVDGEARSLDRLIADAPEAFLGAEIQARFGGMPYLLKLLAAARPLSIQVHPNAGQAEAGFAREELNGIPRDAPERSYRDPRHKPELLVALTDFEALSGFRSPDEIAAALDALPELSSLLPRYEPTPEGLRRLLEAYFTLPDATLEPALAALLDRLRREPDRSDAAAWALRAQEGLGARPDRGLLFVFLLARATLAPGEAMFLSAGVPHAYLEGAGIELMASSDNVLRAGLTKKHVDPRELMRIVRFDAASATRVRVVEQNGEDVYAIPAPELGLSRIPLTPGTTFRAVARGPETLLALPDDATTTVRVESDQRGLALPRGGACLVPDGVAYTLEASGDARVFRASVRP